MQYTQFTRSQAECIIRKVIPGEGRLAWEETHTMNKAGDNYVFSKYEYRSHGVYILYHLPLPLPGQIQKLIIRGNNDTYRKLLYEFDRRK